MPPTDTAELAAAKNLLARIHRDGGHHTEAVGFAQSVADAGDKVSEWLLAAEERTALAAHVQRLVEKGFKMRAAISAAWSADRMTSVDDSLRPVIQDPECDREALAATPAQSLEAVTAPLKAHVERLVGALECVPVDLIHAIENGDTGANVFLSAGSCKLIGDALAATPAQSLAAHDAALLREVAKLMDPDGGCCEALLAEADRREKEGA